MDINLKIQELNGFLRFNGVSGNDVDADAQA